MGNGQSQVVHCDSQSSKVQELPPVPKVENDMLPALVAQAEAQEKEKLKLSFPGFYENAQQEVKNVLTLNVFDGCRFELRKPIGNKLAISHTIWVGTAMCPGGMYDFGAHAVVGDPLAPSTLLIGQISPDGKMNSRAHQMLTENITLKLQGQLGSDPGQTMGTMDLDVKGTDAGVNLKLMGGPLFGLNYLQSVTGNVSIGAEGYYHAAHRKSILSYCAKYSDDVCTAIGTYGSNHVQCHYLRKLNDRTRLASELIVDTVNGEATANIGAEFTFRQSRFVTNLDHTGKVSSTLESKLNPMLTFLLSAEVLHSKGDFKFGYGLQIGQ